MGRKERAGEGEGGRCLLKEVSDVRWEGHIDENGEGKA